MSCICGNKKDYNECCGAIINSNIKASSAEELMRSRYSAYVKGDSNYLIKTLVANNRHADDAELIEEFSNSVKWLKLDVLHVEQNIVEFKAYYKDIDSIKVLHEKSNFIFKNGMWLYVDGELFNSKVERNESCPCGSAKKFKKCCG
ncbi:SEC-C domain-containing protein [Candidatus Sulfurimonas marisnigri]|uniref:SEC-C domain-containing protein n=1 Tax=Candidatus Sulfurimonas marisnigri TaxID=2740405 RepID=A0A7S7LZH2_9BACT|nr:YchJ family metal-binding protein [Candidatus Sulfurimonas marisnigri]QOY54125.1 SEC-C domain-containing protein [Candidatus Sulfurimonas marisnigri]